MKIVSPEILHKTEAGGVIANLAKVTDVRKAYKTIISDAKAYAPGALILGVQIQQMVSGAHEVIVGAVTDPTFGKLVAFGLAGVLVECERRHLPPGTDAARSGAVHDQRYRRG